MNKKEIIEFVPIDGKLYISLENANKSIDIMQKRIEKQKEAIDKAIDFIKNNGAKQYNHHDNYRGKWYSPDELDTILDILKEVE